MLVNHIRWRSKGSFTGDIEMMGSCLWEDFCRYAFYFEVEPTRLDLMFSSARMETFDKVVIVLYGLPVSLGKSLSKHSLV